ncbi:endonuclease activity protein [[Candida] boidinii]|nr:endonuclease activity protein [[Candida] boidinii]
MGYRPWKMVLIVYGFPSKISALQFEHAWQHPYQTRHIPVDQRVSKTKTNGVTINHKLANCKLLLRSNFFKRLGLRVCIFKKDIYDIWCGNRYNVEFDLGSNLLEVSFDDQQGIIEGGNYEQVKKFLENEIAKDKSVFDNSVSVIERLEDAGEVLKCKVCNQEISKETDVIGICCHVECGSTYHLNCWGKDILEKEEKNSTSIVTSCSDNGENLTDAGNDFIVPLKGRCLGCGKANFWNKVAKNSEMLHVKFSKKG